MIKREFILERLRLILIADNTATVYRNRAELPEDMRPGIVLLDGDETRSERGTNVGRENDAKFFLEMTPQVWYALPSQRPQNATVGTMLNTWRLRIIPLILNDEPLRVILGESASIRYMGLATDLAKGRDLNGEMGITLNIRYVAHIGA